MIVYKCDFCGKLTENENNFKRLSITLGDAVYKTQHVCEECSRDLDCFINDLRYKNHDKRENPENPVSGQVCIKKTEYGESYRVVDLGDGEIMVTRSSYFAKDGRKLTRADIYKGRREEAECEYAHAFMCGGFPLKPDPKRPSEEEWMSEEPFPFEVDKYISDKMFPQGKG